MRGWQIVLLVFVLIVGAGYLGRDSIVRVLGAHFFEPTLNVCVFFAGMTAPDRLEIELRSFCNIVMIGAVTRANSESAQPSD